MKGSGSALGNQTYTFVGAKTTTPNRRRSIAINRKPIPICAIDADAFITDNITAIESFQVLQDGTLYSGALCN
jgi:hypothetical protein